MHKGIRHILKYLTSPQQWSIIFSGISLLHTDGTLYLQAFHYYILMEHYIFRYFIITYWWNIIASGISLLHTDGALYLQVFHYNILIEHYIFRHFITKHSWTLCLQVFYYYTLMDIISSSTSLLHTAVAYLNVFHYHT